jgi:hypothetical protein
MLTAESPVVRSPRVLWRAGAFGVVVLAPGQERPVVVDGSGVALWELLEHVRPFGDVVSALAARFGVDRTTVECDARPIVEALVALGACEVRG